MIRKLTLTIALVGIATCFGTANEAQARDILTSVYGCHASGGYKVDSNFAVANTSTRFKMVLRCDIHDDTYYNRKHLWKEILVHGRDGTTTGRIAAQTCRSSYAVPGGACSANSYSSTADVKNVALSLAKTVWDYSHRYDYGYVAISVPPIQGTSRSSINGIKFHK
jgi:hypothetical protein